MTQAIYVQQGDSIDYTPESDVAAGQVVVQNELVGVAKQPIAAGTLGALSVSGVFKMVKATGAINAGAAVYWDADGDPVGGVAGSGAITTTSTDNTFAGFAVGAAGSDDATVTVRLMGIAAVANTIHFDLTNELGVTGFPLCGELKIKLFQ